MLKLKIPPPVYMLAFAGLMWLLNKHFPISQFIFAPWNKIGLLAIGAAFLLDLSSLVLFLIKKTTPNPLRPDNSKNLVITGMYRFSRNPMYVGLTLLLLGWAIYLGSITPFLLVPFYPLLLTVQQIRPEERILEQTFGQDYLDYKQNVRRWL
jgi:protein-S-isoprenylcysteine O-methyltransferase Ste14